MLWRKFSHEIHARRYMMGADAPIPPITIGAAAPAGALPRRLHFPEVPETDLAPPYLGEALRRGALPISSIYKIFIVSV
jgi:hypothetical protein